MSNACIICTSPAATHVDMPSTGQETTWSARLQQRSHRTKHRAQLLPDCISRVGTCLTASDCVVHAGARAGVTAAAILFAILVLLPMAPELADSFGVGPTSSFF